MNLVKSIVLLQNVFFIVYGVYYYMSIKLDDCKRLDFVIVDWVVYSISLAICFMFVKKQTFNLLIVSANMMLSTGYMSELFNQSFCNKGAWTKSYMTVSFITAVVIAFYSLALFAMKHRKT